MAEVAVEDQVQAGFAFRRVYHERFDQTDFFDRADDFGVAGDPAFVAGLPGWEQGIERHADRIHRKGDFGSGGFVFVHAASWTLPTILSARNCGMVASPSARSRFKKFSSAISLANVWIRSVSLASQTRALFMITF